MTNILVSQRTGKKIPLNVQTSEPHDCPAGNIQQLQQGQSHQQTFAYNVTKWSTKTLIMSDMIWDIRLDDIHLISQKYLFLTFPSINIIISMLLLLLLVILSIDWICLVIDDWRFFWNCWIDWSKEGVASAVPVLWRKPNKKTEDTNSKIDTVFFILSF